MSENGNGNDPGTAPEERVPLPDGLPEGIGKFREIAAIAGKISEGLKVVAERMEAENVEFSVGGGQVKATCTVSGTFLKFDCEPALLSAENSAMLGAFLVAAANGALAEAAKAAQRMNGEAVKEVAAGVLRSMVKGGFGPVFGGEADGVPKMSPTEGNP